MQKVLLNKHIVKKIINRLAHEIIEAVSDLDEIVFIGIKNAGVPIAEKTRQAIEVFEKKNIPVGKLDASLYRDDLQLREEQVEVKGSEIPFNIDNKKVIIFDNVICTGRTVRASLDAINDWGRPKSIELAVLIDRGNRELPIQPDYVGKQVTTDIKDKIITDFEDPAKTVVLVS